MKTWREFWIDPIAIGRNPLGNTIYHCTISEGERTTVKVIEIGALTELQSELQNVYKTVDELKIENAKLKAELDAAKKDTYVFKEECNDQIKEKQELREQCEKLAEALEFYQGQCPEFKTHADEALDEYNKWKSGGDETKR